MDAAQREILAGNLKRIRERIAAACARVKRDPKDVTLIAVTKTVGPDVMQALIELGVTDIGENKLQAAQEKFPLVPLLRKYKPFEGLVRRHFIGHLQSNKVNGVLELFDVIHSIDSVKLAERISAKSKEPIPSFLEVNVSGEASKEGVSPEELESELLPKASRCAHVVLQGLMTMAPISEKRELARPYFRKLRELSEKHPELKWPNHLRCLSMGMSNDFEIAIEEGATHVRIGTALFEGISPA